MLQIVYISTARHRFSKAELEEVLLKSRLNNGRAGVTGLLVAGGNRFLQVLEGPQEAVAATYDRIKADDRHFAVVPLSMKKIEGREFGTWSMGYEAGGFGGTDFRSTIEALVAPLADKNLVAQFRGFAEVHARAA
jgi:hypothetical protein